MKSRTKWLLVLAAILLLILGGGVFVEIRHASREAEMRAEVYHWIRSMDWWDHTRTEAENLRRQVEGLRSLGGRGLVILERDLHYNPARLRLLEKIPFLQRLLPQPYRADEPQEVRQRAVYFLGMLGPGAKSAVSELLPLVSDSDARVRFEVAFALGQIGVDSSAVRAALIKMLADSSKDVQFSAAVSLWAIDRADPTTIHRVEKLLSAANLSWPSICLKRVGADASIFAPTLARAIDGMPWSYSRIQAVHALWSMTGDKQLVFAEFESLAKALKIPGGTNPDSGWTDAEVVVGYTVSKLDDDKEFRDRLRPLLQTILENHSSEARKMAEVYLKRFNELDHRDVQQAQPNGPANGSQPTRSETNRTSSAAGSRR
jgi:hypothetical protein